eukprot:jgi/Chlat1/4571/Chrsp29S04460
MTAAVRALSSSPTALSLAGFVAAPQQQPQPCSRRTGTVLASLGGGVRVWSTQKPLGGGGGGGIKDSVFFGEGVDMARPLPQTMRRSRSHLSYAAADTTTDPAPSSTAAPSGLTLPTVLTLARVFAVPLFVAVFYWPVSWAAIGSSIIFIVAAITDWLDGYLARKMNQSSAFGAFLDPVADKLMVAAALVLLSNRTPAGPFLTHPWLMPLPAIAIIGREITMSALREWAAATGGDVHKAVAVNSLGKIKTTAQMTSLAMLLWVRDGSAGGGGGVAGLIGLVLLYVAAVTTLWSLVVYMAAVWKYLFGR